jgi:hypothetical protein
VKLVGLLVSLFLGFSLVVVGAGSADAQTVHFRDPAGDGQKGRALDITGMTVSNRPHRVLVTVSFRRVTGGDLGVGFRRAGEKRLFAVVYSAHHGRHTWSKVASRDGDRVERRRGHQCVRWLPDRRQVRISLPSYWLGYGHFHAIRMQVITEIGSDADYLPDPTGSLDQHWGWTRAVARG